MKPRIAIFFTGGTISMSINPTMGGAAPALSGEEIVARVEGLRNIADFDILNFARLPGPHVTPAIMLELAQAVNAELLKPHVDGVVITHGTDTLEETAYFLDLVLQSEKPVVFVGAMRNSSELSWDGPANLMAAVRVAASTEARELGVVVAMSEKIIAANEVTKTHTESVDTFQSRDFGALGLIDKDRVLIARRPTEREHIATDHLESRVETLKMVSGGDGKFVDFAIAQGTRGIVLEGFGRGNIPPAYVPAVERAAQIGIPIVLTSRCPRGRVLDTYAYDGAGKTLTNRGVILGGVLPSHKVRIKLMLALGAGYDLAQIRQSFED
ncbi:MAG: asparaginase [Blastocatellia bacterium]|nr:asparaginase [Blastocatellia bacterium]